MTTFKNVLILTLTTLFIVSFSEMRAQTYEEWKKQQEQGLNDYKKKEKENFEKFVKERDEMIKKMDQDFSDYLRQNWENYKLETKPKPAAEPKPVDKPVYTPTPEQAPEPVVVKAEPETTVKEIPVAPVLPILQKTEPVDFPRSDGNFNFYGKQVNFNYDQNFIKSVPSPISPEVIASHWDKMNALNYNHLINQLLELKNEMNLNDWGYYMLIKNTSRTIASSSVNASTLIQWFLMTKSNYKCRVAYKDNDIFLLLPSTNTIYGVPFFSFDNRNYYLLESQEMAIFTYDKDFPEARIILDLNINSPLNTAYQKAERDMSFEYEGKEYSLKTEFNQNAINFYKDIPLSDISVYFDAAVSTQTKESLLNQLKPMIEGKPEAEAAELLLRAVQKSFEYKTDQDQFGYEKFFFPDELLAYPYSDCEDRSVLYSYLVRELLGLEVVGLNYPGHMATAVKFTTDVAGDYVSYNNNKYVVCDPTFIGAPIGKAMPQFAEVTAKVVELRNRESKYERINAIWAKLIEMGANRGGNGKDTDFDSQGNAYVTGYFNGAISLGSFNLKSSQETNDIFIAKVDVGNNIVWAYKIGGSGNDVAYNLVVANDNEFYFSGSFTKDIDFAGTPLTAKEKGDVFIAKCPTKGGIFWVNQAGLENLDSTNNVFVASFDPTGNRMWTRVYNESEQFNKYGVTVDETGASYLSGALFANTGLNVKNVSYESYTEFNPVNSLTNESKKLVAANYEKSIIGLFAAVNLIHNSGMSLPGKIVQEAIDKYNPNFRKGSPVIYENLGRIEFIKNSEGIITVRTNDKNPVTFDAVKLSHDSKIKISTFSSGNAQIDILSGVTIGKGYIHYNLNYVKMFKENGDLLFDYDADHTQKRINLGKDML